MALVPGDRTAALGAAVRMVPSSKTVPFFSQEWSTPDCLCLIHRQTRRDGPGLAQPVPLPFASTVSWNRASGTFLQLVHSGWSLWPLPAQCPGLPGPLSHWVGQEGEQADDSTPSISRSPEQICPGRGPKSTPLAPAAKSLPFLNSPCCHEGLTLSSPGLMTQASSALVLAT